MSDSQPVGLAVRLPFASAEEFLQRYGQNFTKGGIFLRSKALKAPGTPVVLEIKLADGQRLLYASAVVAYVTGVGSEGVPGMGFKFITLDGASRRFLESAAAAMPNVRSTEPPVPRNVGAIDTNPNAVPPPPPPKSQKNAALPSETTGRLVVQNSAEVQAPAFEPSPEPERTGPIIGIDLGTTNSCAAIMHEGRVQIIRGRDGQSLIPSMVALTSRGQLVVGAKARAQLTTTPRWVVLGFKRLLGRPFDSPEVQELAQRFPWEVVPTESGDCGVKLSDRVFRLEEISALLLREVKQLAEQRFNQPINRAVITVPAWYTERQRQSVREAGHMAGLYVERIVNEPTAAALAYGYGRKLSQRVLVYDLGGGTFDASVLELNDHVYEVVSTGGDPFLGGMDFDNAIVAWLMAEFESKYDTIFTDRVAIQRVTAAAEAAKIALSSLPEAQISVPFVTLINDQPVDLDATLSRPKLLELTHALIDKTMGVCQAVLKAQRVIADQVHELLLVGGQTKAPMVRERITLLFGKQPIDGPNPEEAVGLGAALLAHSLEQKEGLLLIDVLPMSIGIGLPGGRFFPVIPRNTPLPATRKHVLRTTRDGQDAMEFTVFQGEEASVRGNTYLGSFKIEGLTPGPRGSAAVELIFELTNECLLNIVARDQQSGRAINAVFTTKDTPEQVKEKLQDLESLEGGQKGLLKWVRGLLE